MPRDDLHLLRTVASHLRFLRDEWTPSIDEDSMLRSSNVLRLLLVDKTYGHAWRIAGFKGEPLIPGLNLKLYLGDISDVHWATAGGASVGGLAGGGMSFGIVMRTRALSDAEVGQRSRRPPAPTMFQLSRYLESPCIIFAGETVSRREVIKYVANKLGGTHIDLTDSPKEAEKFARLDVMLDGLRIMDTSAPFYELLSIGQAVGGSEQAAKLVDKVAELVPARAKVGTQGQRYRLFPG